MSLSTLLEAAKYLDYLDSNPQGQQQQQQHDQTNNLNFQQKQLNQQLHITQPTLTKRTTRRQRSSKKDAANTMVAMSLPASTGTMPHSVPIPLASGSNAHGNHHASLSSSFTTESPLSSFASTALMRSKASEVTSASSSAASSLSSSDSSSSCGEILMEDNDFNQSTNATADESTTNSTSQKHKLKSKNFTHQQMISNRNGNNQGNDAQQMRSLAMNNQQTMVHKFSPGSYNERGQSFARYIAATSTGPQLVTMTTTATGGITSASAPIDGRIRAGHVIHAATQNACAGNPATVTGFEAHQFSFAAANGHENQTAFGIASSLNSDDRLNGSSGACPPLMMARVQPMILNSISPSAHQGHLLAFHPAHATASSPTSSSSSYSRHRELHKTLEKNRRAHLRHCFELLKSELPSSECADKKTSHINIIKCAIRYVLALRQQECEIDNELQRLTKIKNELTERLSMMRNMNEQSPKNNQLQEPNQMSNNVVQHEIMNTPMKTTISSSPSSDKSSSLSSAMKQEVKFATQQPVAEQQLSLLLSQSKID